MTQKGEQVICMEVKVEERWRRHEETENDKGEEGRRQQGR